MASGTPTIPRPTAKPNRTRQLRSVSAPYRSPSPAAFVPTPTATARKRPSCPNCGNTELDEYNGTLNCAACGAEVSSASLLVSDQQWADGPSGAAQILGQYVGAGQTHSRTAPLPNQPNRGLGGGEKGNDGAKTKADAQRVIKSFALQFNLIESVSQAANAVFGLALNHGFLSGRTLESVSAVCLYIACRRVRDPDSRASSLMLIDFAEMLNMNVFLLGSIYTKLVERLRLNHSTDRSMGVEAMPPETLVSRFANELEFGRDTAVIRKDAVSIVKRMKRDWMTTGRRQAGICGAAIILAARMNNYRRTVREVVLVAKITELTINKRLEEFQFTESSNLTVEAFKDGDIRDSLKETDPPAYYRAMGQGPQKKRKRKRGRPKKGAMTAAELEEDDEDDADSQSADKRVRLDIDGFKIPPIPNRAPPIDPRLQSEPPAPSEQTDTEDGQPGPSVTATAASSRPRRKGRPAGAKNWQPPPPSATELEMEKEIEEDLQYVLEHADTPTDAPQPDTSAVDAVSKPRPSSYQAAASDADRENDPTAPITSAWESTPEADRPAVDTNAGNTGAISLSPTIDPTEFDDDPEVSICLLSDMESAVKERIWVDENAEWLRKDSMKRVKKELKEKEMREKGFGAELDKKGSKKARRPRKGDVRYLAEGGDAGENGAAGADGQRTRERSYEESVTRMMNVRAPEMSRRLNRDALNILFGDGSGSQGDSGSRSRTGSHNRSDSVPSSAGTEVSSVSEQRERNKMSLAAEKREAAKREARLRQKNEEAASKQARETGEPESSPSTSLIPAPEEPSTRTADTTPSTTLGSPAQAPPTVASNTSRTTRKEHRQSGLGLRSKSPAGMPAKQGSTSNVDAVEDEVLGSVDDSELSSLTSSRNSPMLGTSGHGFGDADGDDEDDESEGDEDDYIEDDVEAALEGRSSRRRRDLPVLVDDMDIDDV